MCRKNPGLTALLAGALALAGCEIAELPGQTGDIRPDPGADIAETLDADATEGDIAPADAGDDGPDSTTPPPLASFCPPAGSPAPSDGLVPEPWQFHDLKALWTVAALYAPGASPDEAEEVQAIAARAGVEVREADGWAVRFLDPAQWPDLAAACGFPADLPAGSYTLRTGIDGALVAAPDVEGRHHALKTLKQLVVAGKGSVRGAAVLDRPGSPIRGVGESYYGEPWAPQARLAMLPILADLKINFYMYAPKFDPAIATFWAYPFSDEAIGHLTEVAAAARKNRIHACMQVHPQGVRFSVTEDFDAVMAKYHSVAALGFDCFALAFDDSEKVLTPDDEGAFSTFVEGQVDWANRVGTALHTAYPDAFLGFVPNDYWSAAEGVATDLAYIGEHLDPVWSIAWTGPEITSRSVTAADAEAIALVIRRSPLLADNHPVVDNTAFSGVMNLAPLESRAPDLTDHVQGIVYNPMPIAHASLPGLATGADFAWNAPAYDPSRSLAAVARWLAGPEAATAVQTLCRANYSPYSNSSAAPALEAALAAFWTERGTQAPGVTGEGPAAGALRAIVTAYAQVPAGLAKASADFPAFLADVKPWSDKLGAEGEAAGLALDLLLARTSGQAVDASKLADLKGRRAALDQTVPKPAGTLLPTFLTRAIAELEAPKEGP